MGDSVSLEESEQRIIKYCLISGGLMLLISLSILISFPIVLIEYKPMMVMPKIEKDPFCKYLTLFPSFNLKMKANSLKSGAFAYGSTVQLIICAQTEQNK